MPSNLSIILFGGFHIFIGETVNSDRNTLVSSAWTAIKPETFAEILSEQDPPLAGTAPDLEISNSRTNRL